MRKYHFDLSGSSVSGYRDEIGVMCISDQSAIDHAWSAIVMLVGDVDRTSLWQQADLDIRRDDGVSIANLSVTVKLEVSNPLTRAMRAS